VLIHCLGVPKELSFTVWKTFVFKWESDAVGLVLVLFMSGKG